MTTLSLVSASDDAFSSCLGGGRSWDLPLPPRGLSTKPARGRHHQVVMLNKAGLISLLSLTVVQALLRNTPL